MDYLGLADYYRSAFLGTPDPLLAEFYRATRFPPLYPAFLGAFGAGSDAQTLAKVLNSCTVVGAAILSWVWAYRQSHRASVALLVGAALCLSPEFFLMNLSPVSEPLAMIFMLGALLLSPESPSSPSLRLLLTALMIGLLTITRSAGVTLVAAWAMHLLVARCPLRVVVPSLLVASLPFIVSSAYRSTVPTYVGYSDLVDWSTVLDPMGGWPAAIYLQPVRVINGFIKSFAPDPTLLERFAAGLVAVLAFLGWIARIRRNRIDAWWIAAYLPLVTIWPYPDETSRLVTFALPVLLLSACQGAQVLATRLGTKEIERPLSTVLAVYFLVSMASAATARDFWDRAFLGVDAELEADKRSRGYFLAATTERALRNLEESILIRRTAIAARTHVAPRECIYAVQPQLIWLYARIPSIQYPDTLDPGRSAESQLTRCRYFFVNAGSYTGTTQEGFHLQNELRGWTDVLLLSTSEVAGRPRVVAALLVTKDIAASVPGPGSDEGNTAAEDRFWNF